MKRAPAVVGDVAASTTEVSLRNVETIASRKLYGDGEARRRKREAAEKMTQERQKKIREKFEPSSKKIVKAGLFIFGGLPGGLRRTGTAAGQPVASGAVFEATHNSFSGDVEGAKHSLIYQLDHGVRFQNWTCTTMMTMPTATTGRGYDCLGHPRRPFRRQPGVEHKPPPPPAPRPSPGGPRRTGRTRPWLSCSTSRTTSPTTPPTPRATSPR